MKYGMSIKALDFISTAGTINQPYIAGSSIKGKFRSILEKFAYSLERDTDKAIITYATGCGKSKNCYYNLFISYYQKIIKTSSTIFVNTFVSKYWPKQHNNIKINYSLDEQKTEKLFLTNGRHRYQALLYCISCFYKNSLFMSNNYIFNIKKVSEKTITFSIREASFKGTSKLFLVFIPLLSSAKYNFFEKIIAGNNKILKKSTVHLFKQPNKLIHKIFCNFTNRLSLEKSIYSLIKLQSSSLFLFKISIEGLEKKMKSKLEVVYELLFSLINCVCIASIPP
jgi:CRISPR/Cas system CSM-associated protein Csm3 (group 7 of RAMP superfamily)